MASSSCLPCSASQQFPAFFAFLLFFLLVSIPPLNAARATQYYASAAAANHTTNNITLSALLAFKIAAWDRRTPSYCTWPGVRCSDGTQTLTSLLLGSKELSGSITPQLGDLPHLSYLDFSSNSFFGGIPRELGKLNSLTHLDLSLNYLEDSIPTSLANCTHISYLDFSFNLNIFGSIPPELGKLTSLTHLDLSRNYYLEGGIPTSLANCTRISYLDFSSNFNTGGIPPELGKLTSLTHLDLSSSHLSGSIPNSLANCTHISYLDFSFNSFIGRIPPELGKLTSVTRLFLRSNNLSGSIPTSLANCTHLQYLDLSKNDLSSIPEGLGELKSLQFLDLSYNSLSGTIPFNSSAYITSLLLSYNNLTGTLPSSWNSGMHMISLSSNHFIGTIPGSLGACEGLNKLDLSVNELNGEIPKTFGNMKSLQFLDLSRNQLSGALPLLSAGSPFFFNFSFNAFQGMIPNIEAYSTSSSDCFLGNPRLCGQPLSVSCDHDVAASRSHVATAFVSIALGVFVLVAIFCACFWWWWNSSSKKCITKGFRPKTIIAWTALEVRAATNDFDGANVIGSGAVSVCYKGVMEDGRVVVAVKIFNSFEPEARESFVNELKTLGHVKHRHLVKVLGYCVAHEGVALVMEFMEHGDLDENLHSAQKCLSWKERVQVAIDVAEGLIYLHHEYDQPMIHCDLKPRNILLGSDMVAKISDFGIAMLLDIDQSKGFSMSKIRGTFGYVAPELASGFRISTKVDVYSYGVLLMEMVTGIRPTSEKLPGVDLHGWVQTFYNAKRTKEIVDEALQEAVTREPAIVQEAEVLLDIGLRCSNQRPKERPTMKEVQNLLVGLRKGKSIHHYPDLRQLL